jgi:uncharacterized protein (DUF433 family)
MSDASSLPSQGTTKDSADRAIEAIGNFLAAQASAIATSLVVSTPDVCGGAARIIRTRIPVWTLEHMRQLGVSEADILKNFPTLRAVDLVQAWAYVNTHRQEIEDQIRQNEED